VVVGPERPHRLRTVREPADALVHLSPVQVRDALDAAWHAGAGVIVLLSTLGADPRSPRPVLSARGVAEELVRASGLRYAVLRPEILWGPGDVFSSEIARLLRHLTFVPAPRGGAVLAPVHVADVARALVRLVEDPLLQGETWPLAGPELLSYADAIDRVARAIGRGRLRRRAVPARLVRWAVALEERLDRRPRVSRALLDRLVATSPAGRTVPRLPCLPERRMTVEALAEYLLPEPVGAWLGSGVVS
jgi:uncharacterized protein YbjT (DUF2867 family)